MYASLGATAECQLLPSSPAVRSGAWAAARERFGCPIRLYPVWFFTGAPYEAWYGALKMFNPFSSSAAVSERALAWKVWKQYHPNDIWMPPFVIDTGSPDISTATGEKPPTIAATAPTAPPTTIPCFCWDSPGFKDAHATAYAMVQRDVCKHDPACMALPATKNLINYRALERGASLCKEEFNPCCHATGGKQSCPGGASVTTATDTNTASTSSPIGKYAFTAVAVLAGYMIWKRRRRG